MKGMGMGFLEAANHLRGYVGSPHADVTLTTPAPRKEKRPFVLPPAYANNELAVACLARRGIDGDIVAWCIENGMLYESLDHVYSEKSKRSFTVRNAVFVGFDEQGIARYAMKRDLCGDAKLDQAGSDKSCSFAIPPERSSTLLAVTEAAIEALSFCTLSRYGIAKCLENGTRTPSYQKLGVSGGWRDCHVLSLGGVYDRSGRHDKSADPLARYLKSHPEITEIGLHLNRDDAGRSAAEAIQNEYGGRLLVHDMPPVQENDLNDLLRYLRTSVPQFFRPLERKPIETLPVPSGR